MLAFTVSVEVNSVVNYVLSEKELFFICPESCSILLHGMSLSSSFMGEGENLFSIPFLCAIRDSIHFYLIISYSHFL